MNGLLSLGEALIDFIPLDTHNISYQKSPGGAPANVAVGFAKLGGKAAFVGKVGEDVLGDFLRDTLVSYGVNVEHMTQTSRARTGLVFVTLDPTGERSFSFYINPSADTFLQKEDIYDELFVGNKILHFGSISLIHEPARGATKKAVQLAKKAGMVISYDPNLRLSLWPSEEAARMGMQSMLGEADLLKISEEELEFITGETEIAQAIQVLEQQYTIPLVIITAGERGCYARFQSKTLYVPAMKVETVDTTGAGDAFVSGLLFQLNASEQRLQDLTAEQVTEMCRFASVSGALAASSKGAMTALPTLEQVHDIVNR